MLQEREHLEVIIQGLQRQIRAGLSKIDEIQEKKQILKDHEADIIANRQFTREISVSKQRKIDLSPGQYTTNCLTCNTTCHTECQISVDKLKYNCAAMETRGSRKTNCKVCPKKCIWSVHVNNPYVFEVYQEKETVTSDQLKAVYDTAMTNKEEIEAVMERMENELEEMGQAVVQNIDQARQILLRLQEIALRPDPLTEVGYIDILIESESLEARPGWSKRVKTLKKVRKRAKILSKVQKGPAIAESLQDDPEHAIWDFWRSD